MPRLFATIAVTAGIVAVLWYYGVFHAVHVAMFGLSKSIAIKDGKHVVYYADGRIKGEWEYKMTRPMEAASNITKMAN